MGSYSAPASPDPELEFEPSPALLRVPGHQDSAAPGCEGAMGCSVDVCPPPTAREIPQNTGRLWPPQCHQIREVSTAQQWLLLEKDPPELYTTALDAEMRGIATASYRRVSERGCGLPFPADTSEPGQKRHRHRDGSWGWRSWPIPLAGHFSIRLI